MLKEPKVYYTSQKSNGRDLDKVPYAEGDEVEVKFMGYDDRKKMRLSRKVLLPRPPRPEQKPRTEGDAPKPEGEQPTEQA